MLVELEIHAMGNLASDSEQAMLLLKEKQGERVLPIIMSTRRAIALTMNAKFPIPVPVPVTIPDMCFHILHKFDIHFTCVKISMIKDATFYCDVTCRKDDVEKTLHYCSAKDGLVMAATSKCPIMIEEELLEAQYMQKTGENSFSMKLNTVTRQMLEDALQHAVENENYEAASRLRDELAKRPIEPTE